MIKICVCRPSGHHGDVLSQSATWGFAGGQGLNGSQRTRFTPLEGRQTQILTIAAGTPAHACAIRPPQAACHVPHAPLAQLGGVGGAQAEGTGLQLAHHGLGVRLDHGLPTLAAQPPAQASLRAQPPAQASLRAQPPPQAGPCIQPPSQPPAPLSLAPSALVSQEEQRHGARPRVSADHRVDVVDDDVAHAEPLAHHLRHELGVLPAVAVGDEHGLLGHGLQR